MFGPMAGTPPPCCSSCTQHQWLTHLYPAAAAPGIGGRPTSTQQQLCRAAVASSQTSSSSSAQQQGLSHVHPAAGTPGCSGKPTYTWQQLACDLGPLERARQSVHTHGTRARLACQRACHFNADVEAIEYGHAPDAAAAQLAHVQADALCVCVCVCARVCV